MSNYLKKKTTQIALNFIVALNQQNMNYTVF